jgi:hypothetical protein
VKGEGNKKDTKGCKMWYVPRNYNKNSKRRESEKE